MSNGRATPKAVRATWTNKQIAGNINRNIRRDSGGTDPVQRLKAKLVTRLPVLTVTLTAAEITQLATFTYELQRETVEGVRARVSHDLEELRTR